MYSLRRSNAQRAVNIWPGFVDGLASLLLVVIFVLMVFMVSQVFLSAALTGRDEALSRLEQQVQELGDLLALERSANAELRINVAQLSTELQSSLEEKESLQGRINAILAERSDLRERLESAQAQAEAKENRLQAALASLENTQGTVDSQREELEELYKTIDADKETIETQLIELRALKSLREELSRELAEMEARLKATEGDLDTARKQAQNAEDRVSLLTARLEQTETRLERSETQLGQSQALSREAQIKIDLLNRQLESLRRQVAKLNAALDAAETLNEEQKVEIADLGRRLNVALATKVQELARYRSEFFGRLREVLGDRQDIRIVGDRFVFQSEVLFESGEADLGPGGRGQIAKIGATLQDIAKRIPDDIDWVLQVEGHTDKRPIRTDKFPSNWELSTARAISVVRVLLDAGIPPDRLAASGYAQYKPLIDEDSAEAYRRNRRIELKLTNRGNDNQ